MFIKSIHLKNWLSHQDTTLAMDKLTVIRADNGAGKTSVEQALEMLFAGRSSSTDDKGSGSRDLIRKGEDKAHITVDIEDAGRSIRMRCSITEKSGRTVILKDPADESWTGSDYVTMLAMKREVLDCLINGRYFIDMDDARQKKLLAGIVLPVSVVWDDWVESAVNQCALRVDWSLKAFDIIALAYDLAYKERTIINRLIKEWIEPESVAPPGEVDATAIRNRLQTRQNERTDLAVKKQKVTDKWQRAQDAKAKAAERIGGLEMRLATEQSRRADIAKGLLSKKAFGEAGKLAAGADKAKEIDGKIQTNAGTLAEVRRLLAKLNDLGESGVCPTCTQPVTDAEFESITKPHIEVQSTLLDDERSLQAERKELGDWEGAVRVLADHEQAEKTLKLVDDHIAGIEKDISDLKKETPSDESQPDTTELDAKIADLDARIQKGNAALTAAVQAETGREQYAKAMEAKKKLDAKRDLLERLIEYFGAKGIQAKLLDEHVGGFQKSMNAVLAGWGFEAHLQFEPFDFSLSFTGKEKVYNLRTISKSQKHAFAIAFQVALAKTTGLNFIVVDEADVFMDANRGQMYRALVGAGLDQVIVMQSDLRREIPKVPNSVFYMLSLDRSGAVPATVVERLT